MTFAPRLLASTALGLCLMATSAAADLTAAQVWNDWRGYLEGMGYAVTANQTVAGDTLAVSDITVQITAGPGTPPTLMRIGALEFVEQDDGSVDVVMPERLPVVLETAPDGASPATVVTLDYVQSGHRMTVRGDPAAMTYDYTADRFGMTLASLAVDGEIMSADAARFAVTGNDLVSQTIVAVGESRTYDQSMQMGSVAYDMFFSDPEDVEMMSIQSKLGAVTFAGKSTLPVDGVAQAPDMMALIGTGFAFDGTFGTQGTETQIEVTSQDGTSKIKTGSASSTLGIAMGVDGLNYDAQAQQVQIGAQLAGVPFPLFAEMATSGFELQSPVVKSEEPQDFKLAFNMTEFTMSDIIWALFDPSGQLPRDPATVALDMSGQARMLIDPLNAEALQRSAASGANPAELEALRIDRLTVDAVGAKLEASGDMTFDNTDKTTLPGFPKPLGEINISLAGANGLMDKLVAMGMVPSEQVMGLRLMMGLFAVPGEAPDTLKSKIEFNEAGQILANGQRIK